jgi:hypothetical protein
MIRKGQMGDDGRGLSAAQQFYMLGTPTGSLTKGETAQPLSLGRPLTRQNRSRRPPAHGGDICADRGTRTLARDDRLEGTALSDV